MTKQQRKCRLHSLFSTEEWIYHDYTPRPQIYTWLGDQVKRRHLPNISAALWVATGRRMWPHAILTAQLDVTRLQNARLTQDASSSAAHFHEISVGAAPADHFWNKSKPLWQSVQQACPWQRTNQAAKVSANYYSLHTCCNISGRYRRFVCLSVCLSVFLSDSILIILYIQISHWREKTVYKLEGIVLI